MRMLLPIDSELHEAIEARRSKVGDDKWTNTARRELRKVFLGNDKSHGINSSKEVNTASGSGASNAGEQSLAGDGTPLSATSVSVNQGNAPTSEAR